MNGEENKTLEGENLTQTANLDKVDPSNAVGETAEDTNGKNQNAYETVISQQADQIEMLLKHTESLQGQIAELIHSGAQIRDTQSTPSAQASQTQPSRNTENVPTLSELGRQIGKPRS